jgi:outer membrane receptor protein involved in Fe transport
MSHTSRSIVSALLVLLALCHVAAAQSTTDGAITGTVSDPTGALVPGARVNVRNMGTNQETTATTGDAGQFRVIHLQPGLYVVTVDASGFTTYRQENIVVEVGRATGLDIALKAGGREEIVEVTSDAPVINTVQQDFSTNINQASINELPINGRRWSNFALLTPGATPDGDFGLISFRGVSGLLNNNTVDGGDNNQAFFSEERGRTRISYVISQASIQEFQVNTSNYSAEYGRSAGGVVNAVTKSGTNDFHGSAFYYQRNNAWGATNPFTKQAFLENGVFVVRPVKPEDKRHQFGGTIGGPIIKDNLFFFVSYDQQKRNHPGVSLPGDPNAFFAPITVAAPVAPRTCANTTIEGERLFCRGITQAQTDAGLAYLASLTGVVPRKGDQYIIFPKIDWRISDGHNLSLSYNLMRWDSPAGVQSQSVVTRGIASFGDDFVDVDSAILKLNSVLTSSLTNELRLQWGRDKEYQNSQPPAPGEPTTGPGGRPPSVQIVSSVTGLTFGKPDFLERRAFPDERRIQGADSVSWARGNHLFKFGVDINRVRDTLDNLRNEGGAYNYTTRGDFIADFTTSGTPGATRTYSSFTQAFGPTAFTFHTWDYNAFIQDDWRIHPRLTLNVGVRYEYQQLPDPQIPNPALPATADFPSDTNNFGPRIGLAWNPWGDGKTAFRGGYGVYYGRIINSTIANAITNTAAPGAQIQRTWTPAGTDLATAPFYPNVNTSVGTTTVPPDVVVFAANVQHPMIQQVDLSFEREVARNTMFSLSYLGSFGKFLPAFIDRNLNPPTATTAYTVVGGPLDGQVIEVPRFTAPRPNTAFGRITHIESTVDSDYHAFVAQFNRRMTAGLQFQTNFTWSHAIDEDQGSQTFTTGNSVLNPFDPSLDRGNSNFDIRKRFVASLIWSPGYFRDGSAWQRVVLDGWTIAPIVSISTGRPFTPFISGNVPGTPTRASTGILGAGGDSRLPMLGRNTFRFPRTENVDLRVSRRIRVSERYAMEVLGEAFNLLNRQNITSVADRMFNIPSTTPARLVFDPTFGNPTAAGNTIFRERQIQLAARFEF